MKKCDASITCLCFPFSHPIFPCHFPRLCGMTQAERYLQHSSLHFSTLYLCKSLIADTLCSRSIKTAKRQLEAFAGKLPQRSRCALEYQALMALKSDTPVPYEAADCLAQRLVESVPTVCESCTSCSCMEGRSEEVPQPQQSCMDRQKACVHLAGNAYRPSC